MSNQNELSKAIETARRVHDRLTGPADGTCVILGALIRAVEILATDQSPGARRLIGTPTNEPEAFPDELVVRLKVAYRNAETAALYEIGDSVGSGIRAVLSELARVPVELPMIDDVVCAYDRMHVIGGLLSTEVRSNMSHVIDLFRNRIAPMIAAKDEEIRALKTRIAEIEKDTEEKQATAHAYIVSLEKQIAELVTPVIVDGKTPGEFLRATFESFPGELNCDDAHEDAADALLRAFGGELLRRVRDKAEKIETRTAKGAIKDFVAIIGDELAKLGQPSASPSVSPTRSLYDSAHSVMHYVLLSAGRPETERWKDIYDTTLKLRDEVKKAEGSASCADHC